MRFRPEAGIAICVCLQYYRVWRYFQILGAYLGGSYAWVY